MTAGVVGVLAEALAEHQHGASVPLSLRAECDKHLACTCGWVSSRCKQMSARDEHTDHQASVVAALPSIAIVPDDAIIPGLGAELRGCIEEYLSGWASTDDAVQPLVGSYFAEGLSDLLSDQIGPILAAARSTGGQA